MEYIYARGRNGARQLRSELPAGLRQKCGVAYYVIETGVGLQQSQSVGGRFCDSHLASAALEAFLERAVVTGRFADQQRTLGGLGQKRGAIGVRAVSLSFAATASHHGNQLLSARVILQTPDALGSLVDQAGEANHLGLGGRRFELMPQKSNAQSDSVEQIVNFARRILNDLDDWMRFPRFRHVGTPSPHRRAIKHRIGPKRSRRDLALSRRIATTPFCERSVTGGRADNHELIVHALDAVDLLRELSGALRSFGRIHIALKRHVAGDSVDVNAGRTNAPVAHERGLDLGGDRSVLGRALGAVKGILRGCRGIGTGLLHFLTGLMHVLARRRVLCEGGHRQSHAEQNRRYDRFQRCDFHKITSLIFPYGISATESFPATSATSRWPRADRPSAPGSCRPVFPCCPGLASDRHRSPVPTCA